MQSLRLYLFWQGQLFRRRSLRRKAVGMKTVLTTKTKNLRTSRRLECVQRRHGRTLDRRRTSGARRKKKTQIRISTFDRCHELDGRSIVSCSPNTAIDCTRFTFLRVQHSPPLHSGFKGGIGSRRPFTGQTSSMVLASQTLPPRTTYSSFLVPLMSPFRRSTPGG